MAVDPPAGDGEQAGPPETPADFLTRYSPRAIRRARDFAGRVVAKATEDNIFFMAGAITFNLLVAVVPLLLLVIGISGFVLSARFGDPAGVILALMLENLPAVGGEIDLVTTVRRAIDSLVQERAGFSVVGAVVLVWISTRLVGTLRTVLKEVFDVGQDRGIVRGKLFDAQIVVIGGVLVLLNVSLTLALDAARAYGVGLVGLSGEGLRLTQLVFGRVIAFASIWVLFLLIYRYLPARRVPWRTALVAATFTGILFEVMRLAFSWYVTSVADYRSTYGNLTTVAILFFWIYYGSVVFILGGEVAQVYTMRRAVRVRTERAVSGGARRSPAWILLAAAVAWPGGVLAQPRADGDGGASGGGTVLREMDVQVPMLAAGDGVVLRSRVMDREVSFDAGLLPHAGRYVVVHLAENRVLVVEAGKVVWSAPAGTGTGFRLAGGGQRWRFTTPKGLFKILRMEKDPVWEAPDWYYVERGLRIPAQDHPSRRIPGAMGTTAIYLGDGIAIHGTNSPQQLLHPDPERRRLSHGCIRLTNEAVRTLYHMVDVGTAVLIF